MSNYGDQPNDDQPSAPDTPSWGATPPAGTPPVPPTTPPPGYGQQPPPPPPPPGYGAPQGYPPPPYGQSPYGYGPSKENEGNAVAVMALGISSLVLMFTCGLGFITAIIALVMAPGAMRRIEESGGRLGGEGLIKTGKVCSWITLGLTVVGVLLGIVWFVLFFALGAAGY